MLRIDTYSAGAFSARVIGALLTLLVFSLVFFSESGGSGSQGQLRTTANTIIQNVTVIDAVSGARSAQDVYISGGLVQSVVAAGQSTSSMGQIVDGTGKFLIPGLWDAHVHLAYDPQIDYRTFFPLSLAHGITSLRDTGGHLDLLAPAIEAARTTENTPDFYFSGPLIDGENRVYDGSSPFSPNLSVGAATAAEAEAYVDEFVAAGASFVKAYEMLEPDVFVAVAARAKTHGIRVAAHVPLSMTAEEAIQAGGADFQHMRNVEFSCAADPAVLQADRQAMLEEGKDGPGSSLRTSIHNSQRNEVIKSLTAGSCDNLIEEMANAGVSQTPTLVVASFFTRRLYEGAKWRETFEMMPPSVRDAWLARSKRLMGRASNEEGDRYVSWIESMLPRLLAKGVPIMAGTDAPIGYLTPGIGLHEELAMLVDAGLAPLEALGAATYAPAAFFGKTDSMGTIGTGMKADLVLLDANPLENIRNTTAIRAVFKNGKYLDRVALDALKAEPSSLN